MKFLSFIQPLGERENNGALQYASFVTSKFSVFSDKKTCEVASHFNRTPHVLSDFTFQCIDQIQNSTSEISLHTRACVVLWHVRMLLMFELLRLFTVEVVAHTRISVTVEEILYNGFSSFTLKKTDKSVEI